MISAVVKENIPAEGLCLLRPGTLELYNCRAGDTPSFMARKDLAEGSVVSVIPLDDTALVMSLQVVGSFDLSSSQPEG